MPQYFRKVPRQQGVRTRLVVGGRGRIQPHLVAEITQTSDNPIVDIRDDRLARLVRSGGTDLAAVNNYQPLPGSFGSPFEAALQATQMVLTTRAPGSTICIGKADPRWSFMTPAVEEARRFLFEDQVEVTLNVHGRHEAQRVTAIFDRGSGEILPGSILEHYLTSELPLPA